MQPAADAEELQARDLIIPWPVVGAFVCIVLVVAIAWVFGGLDLVWPDRNLRVPIFRVISAGDYLLQVFHARIVGFSGMLTAAGIVLALSFRSSGFLSNLRKIVVGALPGLDSDFDKRQRLQAEILIGVVLAIYFVARLAKLTDSHGFPLHTNVFISTTIAVLGFWALLAEIAWRSAWNAISRSLVTGLFILCFALDSLWLLQNGAAVSHIAASYLLGAALLLVANWTNARYA